MISASKKRIAERWFNDYFTEGNLDALDELTTEDFVFHSHTGENSKEKMKEFMEWYRSVFQEDEWKINDLIEQDQKLVVRYTGWMTYKGGWFNIPSDDQRVKETGIMIFYFEGDKVRELWCENSDAAILFNLGALESNTHRIF